MIALFVVATALSASQQPPPTTRPQSQQQQSEGQRQGAAANSVQQIPTPPVSAVDRIPSDRNTPDGKDGGDDNKNGATSYWRLGWIKPEHVSAIAAVISAAFSILIWSVYKGQWKTMDDQAQYMRDGLAETKKAAEAATKGGDTLILLNRPWLDTACWSHDGNVANAFQHDGRSLFTLSVSMTVVNLGNSPARIRYITGGYQLEGGGRVEHSSPTAVSHVINPKGTYPYTIHIGPLDETHRAFYESREGLHVGLRGAIYFDDLFGKVGAPEKPRPFSKDQPFDGRVWHYGRYGTLRASGQPSVFTVPFGEEGVGVNDEDWKEGKNQGQSEDQP